MTDQTDIHQSEALLEPVEVDWDAERAQATAPEVEQPAKVVSAASLEDLVRAREAIGFGASDVASMLGMATRQVEAIERGDWRALPGQAFIRSAIRAYGKAVGTDVAPLLETIGRAVGAPVLEPVPTLRAVVPKGGFLGFSSESSGSRIAWIVLGLAAIVAIAFHFGGGTDSSETGARVQRTAAPVKPAVETPGRPVVPVQASSGVEGAGREPPRVAGQVVKETPPVPGATQSTQPAQPLPPVAAPPVPPVAAPVSERAVPTAQTASPAPAQPAQPAPAALEPGHDLLSFRFEQESWVEIRDASGKVIHVGLQPAGSTLERSGRKPLALVIGNAANVRLERNGVSVELAPRSPSGVARLTLD